MTERVVGRVRFLPADTPGLPPSVPFKDGKYDDESCCAAVLWTADEPRLTDIGILLTEGAYCTRPLDHLQDEIHVCRLRDEQTGEPTVIIVWGGE
jgi:hypothetical protein